MSITLITGSLGTGKTALAIKLLTEHAYYPDNAVIIGVREWKGEGSYYELPSAQNCVANQQMIEEVGQLSGTVYLVDEAKKIWPSRIAGKPVPTFIDANLAESRSISQDWIITAQAPGQLDVKLRNLVGRHIHLEKVGLGIKYSEAGQIREDLQFSKDESSKYVFPKESLKYYKSDDGVTDLQKKGVKFPARLKILLFLILVFISGIGYFMSQSKMLGFGNLTASSQKSAETSQSSEKSSIDGLMAGSSPVPKSSANEKALPLSQAPDIYHYMPKDPAFPEIAKAPRIPKSCLNMQSQGCVCYDQYLNRIKDFPEKRCNDIINGLDQVAFTRDSKLLN